MAITYCTYITAHESSGLYYIGKAKLENVNSGYKGSGVKLRKAFKEFPKSEWKCSVLWEFETSDEAYSDEAGIITYKMLQDPLCLNSCMGGGRNAGKIWTDEQRKAQRERNIKSQATPEAKLSHSIATKRRYQDPIERAKTSEAIKKSWILRRLKKENNDNL